MMHAVSKRGGPPAAPDAFAWIPALLGQKRQSGSSRSSHQRPWEWPGALAPSAAIPYTRPGVLGGSLMGPSCRWRKSVLRGAPAGMSLLGASEGSFHPSYTEIEDL